jgi:hypothetical protein
VIELWWTTKYDFILHLTRDVFIIWLILALCVIAGDKKHVPPIRGIFLSISCSLVYLRCNAQLYTKVFFESPSALLIVLLCPHGLAMADIPTEAVPHNFDTILTLDFGSQ